MHIPREHTNKERKRDKPGERGNVCGKGKGNVCYYDTAKGRQSPNWACCTKSTIFVKFICAD